MSEVASEAARGCAIKICGLFRECDIDYVNEAGPDYAGFILNFPKSHRNLEAESACRLREKLKAGIRPVGVFVDQPLSLIEADAERMKLFAVQLHGHEDEGYIAALKKNAAFEVWKAFKVRSRQELEMAEKSCADRIVLDKGYGSGESFDWSLLKGFRRPFILAGGLRVDKIPEALRLRPEIIDISSGVETGRLKDKEKIIAAVRAAHYQEERYDQRQIWYSWGAVHSGNPDECRDRAGRSVQ